MPRLEVTFGRRGTLLLWTVSDGRDERDYADCSKRPVYKFKRRIGSRVVYYYDGIRGASAWTCLTARVRGGYRQRVGIDLWIENGWGRPSRLAAMRMVAGAWRP